MRVIDSHTEGEPTRLIIEGGPDLGSGSMADRRACFARDFDHIRSFCVNEPRGYDALVGGPLGAARQQLRGRRGLFQQCRHARHVRHGTIGLAVTLAHMGRIGPGLHRIETPVGIVSFELLDRNTARITNVESYRSRKAVTVEVPASAGHRRHRLGRNWFFLTNDRLAIWSWRTSASSL